jgi:hypothetical protein
MAFFYTNLIEFYTPIMKGDTLVFPVYLPEDFRAPFVDPLTATGPAVLEIISNPDLYAGKSQLGTIFTYHWLERSKDLILIRLSLFFL